MIGAAVWDGIGSSVVGAVIGALTVVLGGFIGYRFAERTRKAEAVVHAVEGRRRDAKMLTLEVSELRDAATQSSSGLTGDFMLYRLRKALLLAETTLYGRVCLDAASSTTTPPSGNGPG
jgi:hypothetical protein